MTKRRKPGSFPWALFKHMFLSRSETTRFTLKLCFKDQSGKQRAEALAMALTTAVGGGNTNTPCPATPPSELPVQAASLHSSQHPEAAHPRKEECSGLCCTWRCSSELLNHYANTCSLLHAVFTETQPSGFVFLPPVPGRLATWLMNNNHHEVRDSPQFVKCCATFKKQQQEKWTVTFKPIICAKQSVHKISVSKANILDFYFHRATQSRSHFGFWLLYFCFDTNWVDLWKNMLWKKYSSMC